MQGVSLRGDFRKQKQESGEVRRGRGDNQEGCLCRAPRQAATVTPLGASTEHVLGVIPPEGRGSRGGCAHTRRPSVEVYHVDAEPQAAAGAGGWEAGRQRTKC